MNASLWLRTIGWRTLYVWQSASALLRNLLWKSTLDIAKT